MHGSWVSVAQGAPDGCSYQSGLYQCPNKGNFSCFRYRIRCLPGLPIRITVGWECKECGAFYLRDERIFKKNDTNVTY
jgi:hypothetical protein